MLFSSHLLSTHPCLHLLPLTMNSSALSDSFGSLPSMDALNRPPAIDCPDCKVNDWSIEAGATMVIKLDLCSLHQNGIFAATSPQTRQNPPLSPTPPNALPSLNPNSDRTLSRGTGPALSQPRRTPNPPTSQRSRSPLHRPPASTPRRSRSPLRRPLPASPPRRGHAPYSRTSRPDSCLALYGQMREAALDRRHPRTVKEAYTFLKVANRTWRRKQKIAELMILDRSRFDEVVAGLMGDYQQSLFERCKAELKKPALVRKKRDAILSGDII